MRRLSQRSPTVDGERLFVVTADGECVCLSTMTGEELWRISYPSDFDATHPQLGFCDRPLVDCQALVCVPGGKKASIAALDKTSGKVIWQTLLPDARKAAYGTTVVAECCGIRQYIALLGGGLFGVRASNGKVLWTFRGNSNSGINSHTPIVRQNIIYHGNGHHDARFVAIELVLDDNNEFSVKELYLAKLPLDPFQDSTVVVDDYLFTFRSAGLPMCADLNTGKLLWGPIRTEGSGKAAISYADNRFYTSHSNGRVTLVEPSRQGYAEKGHFEIPEHKPSSCATFPVITGGRLYLRDDNRLFCFDVRRGAKKREPIEIRLSPANQ